MIGRPSFLFNVWPVQGQAARGGRCARLEQTGRPTEGADIEDSQAMQPSGEGEMLWPGVVEAANQKAFAHAVAFLSGWVRDSPVGSATAEVNVF